MRDKKLQVFVSSTYTDLISERQAAVEAILSSGHIPAGMELFTAGDESQMTVIERWIDESDIYLLILGGRYGSIDKKTGKSYTHLEYEYAVSTGKPLFAVVIMDEALEAKVKKIGSSVLEQEHPQKLKEFKAMVLNNLVKFWADAKDIKIAIHETLADFDYRKELVGWIRGDNSVNTGFLAEEIARLTKENSELRNKLNEDGPNILYSGLSFRELERLLKEEIVKDGNEEISLFDYIIKNGERLLRPNRVGFADKLLKYNIVDRSGTPALYKFTEDGHRFYLKVVASMPRQG
jgi:hypothetical protein